MITIQRVPAKTKLCIGKAITIQIGGTKSIVSVCTSDHYTNRRGKVYSLGMAITIQIVGHWYMAGEVRGVRR